MKKIAAIFMAIILVINLAIPARAASEEYEVSEMDISLEIPDEYIVFTRDMDKNDPHSLILVFLKKHLWISLILAIFI